MDKIIPIYRAENEMEAYLIKGLLESNGIKATTSSDNTSPQPVGSHTATATPNMPFLVYVMESMQKKAEEILKQRGD